MVAHHQGRLVRLIEFFGTLFRQASDMLNFSEPNLPIFSMHDLDPSRTPMWKIGHTKLGDHWIPVALPPPT